MVITNVIMVFDHETENMLMCRREKDPYKGLLNMVGGKLEKGESGENGAYRELFEETGITGDDISLRHLMDIIYDVPELELQVYCGRLKHDVTLVEEVNRLVWVSVDEDFFDSSRFAGEGSIGHMMERVKLYRSIYLA